jgi:hypothetical protein
MADDPRGSSLPPHPTYPSALGTAIWAMPDEALLAAIDEMASSSRARGDVIGYYLDELSRREHRRLARQMVKLTWVVAALTVVITGLTAASLVAVLQAG